MKKIFLASLFVSFLITGASAKTMSDEFVLQKSNINNNSIITKMINKQERPSNGVQTKGFLAPDLCEGIPPGGWVGGCQCGFGGIIICHQF